MVAALEGDLEGDLGRSPRVALPDELEEWRFGLASDAALPPLLVDLR